MACKPKAVLVAATDLSGCAFSPLQKEIMVIKWNKDTAFKGSFTVPSSALVETNGVFIAYGLEAEKQYKQEDDEHEKSKMLLFRNLYSTLREGKLNSSKAVITSDDGTIRPALDIFANTILYIREYLLDTINASREISTDWKERDNMFRWVVVLPNEKATQFMQNAIEKAGSCLGRHAPKYVMITENAAVSVALQRPNIITFKDSKNATFVEGTQYILLNCRDTATDIVAQRIMTKTSVETIMKTGGSWGKDMVIRNLVRLIGEALGNNFVNRLQAELPQVWSDFIMNFERWNPRMTKGVTLNVTFAFGHLFAEMNHGTQIDKHLQKGRCVGVSFSKQFISINASVVKGLFDPVVNGIIQETESVLQNAKVRGSKYIVMVGEFSKNEILQKELKTYLERDGVKVLIPNEPEFVILKGATLYGHCK